MAKTDTVRWGILGAGRIARRFAASLEHEPGSELMAVSGRTPERLQAFAEEFGVPRTCTYDELLADPDIDAVYLSLPHSLHH